MVQIRFDDLDALRSHAGGDFGPWGRELTVTQDLVDRFADLTHDHQWIHVDPERARGGPFGTTIAHGFLTLAMLPAYRAPETVQVVGASSRVNYGCDRFRFLAPVRVDSAVRARSRLVGVREHARGTLVTDEIVVGIVGAERPALTYLGVSLYQA